MFNNEFINFKFGNYWASEFHLVAVSSSDRYSFPMFGSIDANTTSVSGKKGIYKYNTQFKEKIFTIKVAYDDVPLEYLSLIKQWLNPEKVKKLSFSDAPYKYYYACVNSDPEFTYLPFLNGYSSTGNDNYQNGIIKGEGTISFVCLDNNCFSEYETFNNPNVEYSNTSAAAAGQTEDNYMSIVTSEDLERDGLYDILNITNYESLATDDYESKIFYFDEDIDTSYNMLVEQGYSANAGASVSGVNMFKPWVVESNLLKYDSNYPTFYSNNLIHSKSIKASENSGDLTLNGSNNILYLMNSGNEYAPLTMEFTAPSSFSGSNNIKIVIKEFQLEKESSSITWTDNNNIISQIEISDYTSYKPYTDFVEAHTNGNFKLLIDSVLKELFIIEKNSGDKLNLSRFNVNQSFLCLKSCKFIDYTKPFPVPNSSVLNKNTSLRDTIFNKIYIDNGYTLYHVGLEWKHTYL